MQDHKIEKGSVSGMTNRQPSSGARISVESTTFVIYGNTFVRYAGASGFPKMECIMPQRKKTIRHDDIVSFFGERLRELRLSRGMSQAELAQKAHVTTNYISRLEGGGAAPGIDLVARLALALGVPIADLLPTGAPKEELVVIREQAQRLFQSLLESKDRAVLVLLTQLLARLAEATNR